MSKLAHRFSNRYETLILCPNAPSTCEIRPTNSSGTLNHMTDAETKEQLRKLAAEYIERAAVNESEESSNAHK